MFKKLLVFALAYYCHYSFGQISVSHQSGFYTGHFLLEIIHNAQDSIYYNFDGSIPNKNDILYTTPISISFDPTTTSLSYIPTNPSITSENYKWTIPNTRPLRGTIFTAAVIQNDTAKQLTYRSFFNFSPDYFSFPIVSIIGDSIDFFGYEEGIYVPGIHYDSNPDGWQTGNYFEKGDQWEKNIHIEFIADGIAVLEQKCIAKTHGSASKIMPAKSLRLYAKNSLGASLFDYPFFQNKTTHKHKRLILRNSGQDFIKTLFKDAFVQSLISDVGLEFQSSTPCVLFLNGEYWGIHNIRERYDRFYLQNYHNENIDSVDLIEISMKIEANEGDTSSFMSLINFAKEHDLSINSNYQTISELIDLPNFIDYQITNIFFSCYDWPGNNVKAWKSKNGKWRWLIMDTDMCFSDYEHNTLIHALNEEGDDWPNPAWSTLLFRKLMMNISFQKDFSEKFSHHLNTTFCEETILQKADSFQSLYEAEIQEHINRWNYPASKSDWYNHIENLRTFAQNRPTVIQNMLDSAFATNTLINCVNDSSTINTFDVSPNPANQYISLTTTEKTPVKLYNTLGQLLLTSEVTERPINIAHLSAGVYFITQQTASKTLFRKFIKQ